MKRIVILSALLLASYCSRADYSPMPLYEMVIKAEKIVYGTIVELDSNYFFLKIEGSLTSDTGIVKVSRFQDWACAARWTEYRVGQGLFLFLTTWNDDLVSMGAGNEGELPIIDNTVYIHGASVPIPPPPPPSGAAFREDLIYFETAHFDLYERRFFGINWNLGTFIETISFIRQCFDFTYGQFEVPTNWQITCDAAEIEPMCRKSKLIDWVYYEAHTKE